MASEVLVAAAARGANTSRLDADAAALGFARRLRAAAALSSNSHSTLPSTAPQQPHPHVEHLAA